VNVIVVGGKKYFFNRLSITFSFFILGANNNAKSHKGFCQNWGTLKIDCVGKKNVWIFLVIIITINYNPLKVSNNIFWFNSNEDLDKWIKLYN